MLFSGLACFSPTVPSYIRKSWVMNGGTLTHNADDFRKANFFFCDGMEDPWLNELLSRSLIVRHAAWVTLCVLEDFLMPIADYTLDDGFDESKIRISQTNLPGTTSSALVFPARTTAVAVPGIPTPSTPPAAAVQPTNPRKRRHDDAKNEGGEDQQENEDISSENGRPRKKARRDLAAKREAPSRDVLVPQPTTPPPPSPPPPPTQQQQQQRRRRHLPFAFSTVRGAQAIFAGDAAGRARANTSDDQERQMAEKGNGIADIGGAGSGNRKTAAVHVQSLPVTNAGLNIGIGVGESEIPSKPKPKGNGISVPKSRGRPNLKIKKAALFEKLIVRSENGGAPARRPAQVFPRPRLRVHPAAAATSLASTAPPNADLKRTKTTINTHTLFWNDILAKCLIKANNAKDAAAPSVLPLKLSVGDLLHAPRTKAVIFDVNKTYRGRRFISLDND